MHREFVFGGEVKFVEGYFGKSGLLANASSSSI